MYLHKLNWQRSDQPALSAMTTAQDWCRVQLYNPAVAKTGDTYRMWYVGNATATRTDDMDLGYAESEDGIHWTEHPGNPILGAEHLPWGSAWQTPHVTFDADEGAYRMWFIMAASERDADNGLVSFGQQLGYATSADGRSWQVHPEPLYPSGRGPCVIKDGPDAYRMWMNSAPEPGGDFSSLTRHIYRFTSPDGIRWARDPEPAVTAGGNVASVVYPFVMEVDGNHTMWYSGHVDGGLFEIFCSTSPDGLNWTHHHNAPAFAATRDPDNFDGRYTSTPCLLDDGDRYLLYYSTRDLGNLYGAGDGTIKVDRMGIYRHIGVAVSKKVQRKLGRSGINT